MSTLLFSKDRNGYRKPPLKLTKIIQNKLNLIFRTSTRTSLTSGWAPAAPSALPRPSSSLPTKSSRAPSSLILGARSKQDKFFFFLFFLHLFVVFMFVQSQCTESLQIIGINVFCTSQIVA